MRRVEIRLTNDTMPFLNMLFVIEDKDKFVCTNLDGKILVYPKKEYDFRFLDPPEEKEIPEETLKALIAHKHIIQELEQRVEKLENDYPFNFNRTSKLNERIEELELNNKAFNNAFANLGVPVHPACVQKFSYTEEEIRKAYSEFLGPFTLSEFLSELRKNKEGK